MRRKIRKLLTITQAGLLLAVFPVSGKAVINNIKYIIHVPVLIENSNNLSYVSNFPGRKHHSITIRCAALKKSEMANHGKLYKAMDDATRSSYYDTVEVDLMKSRHSVELSFTLWPKHPYDYYACAFSYSQFGSIIAKDKNSSIDLSQSVLIVTGKLPQ